MKPEETMVVRDLHVRYTYPDGRMRVQCHRVWNAQLFMEARVAEASNLNAEVKGDGKRLANVSLISAAEYQKRR